MPSPHRKFLLPLIGAGALLLVGGIVGTVVLLSGSLSTAATKQHFRITHRLLEIGLRSSVTAQARNIQAPQLDDPQLVEMGLTCYRDHCAQCHGAPGQAPEPAALGMLPVPVGLAQTAREWGPERLYYVTSKGVRMTGMPAWEVRLSERSLWATVAFIETLPRVAPAEYRQRAMNSAMMCEPRTDLPALPRGELGDILMRQYACHACHVIDGVVGPQSNTGPSLHNWPQRGYIAGVLPNTHANLVRFIRHPQQVSPGTLMPDLNVPLSHAEALATFLMAQR